MKEKKASKNKSTGARKSRLPEKSGSKVKDLRDKDLEQISGGLARNQIKVL